MKRIFLMLIAAFVLASFSSSAFDLKNALKQVANSQSNNDSTTTTGGGTNGSSALGGLLGGLSNLLGKTDVTVADLEGTWSYVKPAVAFKSENLLKKAGGDVAASMIEEKIQPYYEKAGFTALKLTVKADSTFTMNFNHGSLSGTLEKDKDSNFVFNFKALGKINIGHASSVITKSGNNITVTFDASKLITLVSKVASITGNSTISGVSSLLQSYDGLNAGFELKKDTSTTTVK